MTVVFLSLFFLLSRILLLLFRFQNYYPTYPSEDLPFGTLSKELIEGLKLPFLEYAVNHYHGGAFVYGVLTVPFFLLFGKNVFALRLTALFFQYGAFILWYLFIKRFFGKKAALYTALLYLCSPPWLTLYAMFANGCHPESLFFTILGLFLLYKILYEKNNSLRNSVLLGLVCGFGTYFTYGVLVSTVSFMLFWIHEDYQVLRKKEGLFFPLSFLIGFSPWVVYNSLHQFHGMDVFKSPYEPQLVMIPFRFLKLATFKILAMLSFNYRETPHLYKPHITFLNALYYAAVLFSYGILYQFERNNKKTRFFFFFPLLYLAVASMSPFLSETYFPRYLVPLFPFFFAVIALGLSRLGSLSRNLQRVSVLILVLLLAMGVKGELNLVALKDFKLCLRYRGY